MASNPQKNTSKHKLTAIMFADIVGFTTMMGRNEENALEVLENTKELIRTVVDNYEGFWHKDLGDGVLVSFESTWLAVQCALEIQEGAKNVPGMVLRIGIHTEDVNWQEDDIIGDGVNIASRIQEAAKPGGICISENVFNSIKNKEGISTKSVGVRNLKNVARPMELFYVSREMALEIYKEKLHDLEALYDSGKYKAAITESVELAEMVISIFITYFHTTLKDKQSLEAFLSIEKSMGPKFHNYIASPSITTSIEIFDKLHSLFPQNPWLNPALKSHLEKINKVSYPIIHEGITEITEDDAGRVIDAVEGIIKLSKLSARSVEVIGFPLKYYLIYKSVSSMFENSDKESSFRKIVADSNKVIPTMLSAFLNRIYNKLPIESKEKLLEKFDPTKSSKKQNETEYYFGLYEQASLFKEIDDGESLRNSLQEILESKTTEYNKRNSRHYVNILDILVQNTVNPNTWYFLNYADEVKVRYLKNFELTENDKKDLKEKSRSLNISEQLAQRIDDLVVNTIEKELILYLTLTDKDDTEPALTAITEKKRSIGRPVAYGIAAVMIIFLLSWYFIGIRDTIPFEDYEMAYFEGNLEDAQKLSKKQRNLKNIKANYYYIISTSWKENKIPIDVKKEYQQLLKDNPESAEAHFYLSLTYNYSNNTWREERDSVWILLDRADQLGAHGLEFNFAKWQQYRSIRLPQKEMQIVNAEFIPSENPLALKRAANSVIGTKFDSAYAEVLLKRSLEVYPRITYSYMELVELYIEKGDMTKVWQYIDKWQEITPHDEDLIRTLAEINKKEGKFDEAKRHYINAIEGFGKGNINFYYGLLDIYLAEDNMQEGNDFLEKAFISFPKDQWLFYYKRRFKNRENWIAEQKKLDAERILLEWGEDYEIALKRSEQEGKPIIVDFWTSWCYWCKVLDKKVYPDSAVQSSLANYILLKINADLEIALAKKYDITAYPTLLVLEDKGKRVYKIEDYVEPFDFAESLATGVEKYNSFKEGESITREKFTEVINSEDAQIIADKKNIPIMVVIGDSRSEWSNKLVNETLQDEALKSEFTDIVYLFIDKSSKDPIRSQLKTSVYPTIFFTDSKWNVITQKYGYQPTYEFVELLKNVKEHSKDGEPLEKEINWLYNLEEAKSLALVNNKKIFIASSDPSCDPCNQMNEYTYLDTAIINLLTREYISVFLDANYEEVQISTLGINIYPNQLISSSSGDELFKSVGYKDPQKLKLWLTLDDKLEILSVLGNSGYKKYYESKKLANSLSYSGRYQSSINILERLTKELPDLKQPYYDLAMDYKNLQQHHKAIENFKNAINAGQELDQYLMETMMLLHLAAGIPEDYLSWLDELAVSSDIEDNEQAYIHWAKSYTYEILQDTKAAIDEARQAVAISPNLYAPNLQLARLLYETKKYKQAEKLLLKAEELDKSDPVACFYRGLIAELEGDFSKKEECWETALTRSRGAPWQVGYGYFQGYDNFEKYPGMLIMLAEGYEYGIRLNPEAAGLYAQLSEQHILSGKTSEQTLAYINKALEIEPDYSWFQFIKSWVLIELGKINEAEALVKKAVENTPMEEIEHDIYELYILGLINYHSGNKDLAGTYLKKVVNFREASGSDKRIQGLVKNFPDESMLIKSL